MFDIEKIYRKPIFPTNNYLSFNRLGYKINNHPIVILELEDDIVFLTAQSAVYKNGSYKFTDNFINKKVDNEEMFLLKRTNDLNIEKGGLFYNDSLVDTTSLFVMNKDDFKKCYCENNKNLYATRKINLYDWNNILEQTINNFEKNNITINRVILEQDKNLDNITTKTELLYSNKKLLEDDLEHIKSKLTHIDLKFYNFKINNLSNNNEIKLYLQQQIDNEYNKTNYKLWNDVYTSIDEYLSISYNTRNEISTEKIFELPVEKCCDYDFETQLEIESFSDFEKEYYKQNPKEFDDKYWTYLDQLKTQYNEWKQEQTKQQDKGFEM